MVWNAQLGFPGAHTLHCPFCKVTSFDGKPYIISTDQRKRSADACSSHSFQVAVFVLIWWWALLGKDILVFAWHKPSFVSFPTSTTASERSLSFFRILVSSAAFLLTMIVLVPHFWVWINDERLWSILRAKSIFFSAILIIHPSTIVVSATFLTLFVVTNRLLPAFIIPTLFAVEVNRSSWLQFFFNKHSLESKQLGLLSISVIDLLL